MFSWFTGLFFSRRQETVVEAAFVETVTERPPFVYTGPTMASSLRTRKPSRRRHGAQHVRRSVRP